MAAADGSVPEDKGRRALVFNVMDSTSMNLRQPCGFPAPLVANGAAYVGCDLDAGHDGLHEITVKWGTP